MKHVLLLFLFIGICNPYQRTTAQTDACLPTRFMGGQEARVVGSLDMGGLPYRSDMLLSAPVLGTIPLDTVVMSHGMQSCIEGRNWYQITYPPTEEPWGNRVWVTDGIDQTYWLEPVRTCGSMGRTEVFPSSPSYSQGLIVDGYDPETDILRFSAEYFDDAAHTLERHYLNFQVREGVVTRSDYWYRDLITPELTDQLGITEHVFGETEDFTRLYVSPDQTKLLYSTQNPTIPDCAHGCTTSKLWVADIDGSNPIPLGDYYGWITRVIWEDTYVQLSLTPIEVFEADFTLTFFFDGRESIGSTELILGEGSLLFDHVFHLPTESPNREWLAVTASSEVLNGDPILRTGVILNRTDDRYIQLPNNGGAAAAILWLDEDTILYPVMGLGRNIVEDGLPRYFYEQDALWEIHLDFETLSFHVGDRLTHWVDPTALPMLLWEQTTHILIAQDRAILYSDRSLAVYCFSRG